MKDGFLKVACATVQIKVADVWANKEQISSLMQQAAEKEVRLLVLPELCLTGYTCGELFLQQLLLKEAETALLSLAKESERYEMITVVGVPIVHAGKLYNCAAFLYQGEILGLVPKTYLPSYCEFYEARHFTSAKNLCGIEYVTIGEQEVAFGTHLLFANEDMEEMVLAAEICEDLWVPNPPGVAHAMAGATILVNPSASVETTTKEAYRRNLVSMQSGRLLAAYLYADAGEGESTTDVVYSGHNLICENGSVLAEAKRFENEMIVTEIDLYKLVSERRKMSTFLNEADPDSYETIWFSMPRKDTVLTRTYPATPFVPGNEKERTLRCEEIFSLQSMGLKKRLKHTNAKSAVIGISGGLDSTLALLVTVRAFDLLGKDRKDIICVTMPGFGTTDRTYHNACDMVRKLHATLLEVSIVDAVTQHFKDIGQDLSVHDVTYENGQARERTQILMDIANKENGMVIGTGDMSELALGWATYNGDHMSMYAVNASVPKTLVRHLVRYYADICGEEELRTVLLDVLDTPVSPELLPPKEGEISQKTEDLVGPYELHDFFLYFVLRFGFPPKKIYRLACDTFKESYERSVIYKWLRTFYWRFFAQQFKRSCLPDGPKVGSVAVSPRGDLRMPSDAASTLWMKEMDAIGKAEGFFDAGR